MGIESYKLAKVSIRNMDYFEWKVPQNLRLIVERRTGNLSKR